MDFSVIFQLRQKKFWWMDVIFYFAVSLLVATVLCYLIFLTKNSFQRQDIQKETVALHTVGTDQQKAQEKDVINYRNKINDFTALFQNHEFASNAFAFMQTQTMPNIWFKQFTLDEKNSVVQLSGEADNMDAFSRQVATFEKNQYVKSVGTLNSSLGQSTKIEFNIDLALDQNIFNYIADMAQVLEPAVSPATTPANNLPSQAGAAANPQTSQAQSSEKLITSFDFLLTPAVIGTINETNYTVTLNVPFGTGVKSLTPSIVASPGAVVSPASDVSQDFTNSVTYIVTAQDGSTQTYKVSVNILPEAVKKSNQAGSGILVAILFVIAIIFIIAVIIFFLYKKRLNNKQQI
ncbi:MAG: DUF5018 domain-containing protein [Candidatus Staskawiczbacteria bacterium]|jgi:hypothetical protein